MQCLGPHENFHLEDVALGSDLTDERIDDMALVQAETARDVCRAWIQHKRRKHVGTATDELALQIPAVNTRSCCWSRIPSALHDVSIRIQLLGDHVGNKFGVVRKVCIHDNHKVARASLETVNVGCS